MNPHFKFETLLQAAFGVALVVFVALAASAWFAAKQERQAMFWVNHTHEVLARLAQVEADTLLVELSSQNFRLSGDPAHIAVRDAAITARELALHHLNALTRDNPRQQTHWTQLRATTDERLAIWRRVTLLYRNEGTAAANAYVASAPLAETRERLFGTLRAMAEEEHRLLRQREADQTKVLERRTALTSIVLLLLAALLAATYAMIRRQARADEAARLALEAMNVRLGTVLNNMVDGLVTIDGRGIIESFNPAAERIFGYRAAEVIGQNVNVLMPEPYHSEHDGYLERYRTGGEARVIGIGREVTGRRKDGSTFPMDLAVSEMLLNGERRYTGLVRDISARKEAERTIREQNERLEQRVRERTAQLRESEAKLQAAFENVNIGLVICDAQGGDISMNAAALKYHGFTSTNDMLRRVDEYADEWELHYPDGRIMPYEEWPLMRAIRGEYVHDYEAHVHNIKTGYTWIGSYTSAPVRNSAGQIALIVMTLIDITERKRAEQQQGAEKSALEVMSLGRPLPEILDTIARNIEALSPGALCSILLLDEDGLHLRHGAAPSLPQEYNRAIEGHPIGPSVGSCGTAAYRNEQVIVADIATDPLWADYAALAVPLGLRACWSTPVRSGAGKVLATFAVYYREPRSPGQADLNLIERWARLTGIAIERKRDEDEIRKLNENLERRVAERTRQLEEASRAKSDFLANMSHELRTPLNSIIGFSEMLKDGVLGELDEKQRGFVADIYGAGTHLLSLINDILDLSKVEAGMLQLEAEPVDLPALLKASTLVVREKAIAHRIRLDTRLDPALGTVLADERKLKQIVYNLLANAVKFTPEGGTVLLAARRCLRTEVGFDDAAMPSRLVALPMGGAAEFLEITVEDSGVGIAEADLAKLFESFTQVDSSIARRHAGTGLGLSLVRRLAELHGGTVGVSSRVGGGSVFRVWLPYREFAGAAALAEPQATPATRPALPLALVIEDDDRMADLIAAQLHSEGFSVIRAATAEEGLVRAAKRRPDLITLDIFLPNMDGWECMRRLKAEPRLADTPVVIITVSGDMGRGLALGARRVLQKPFAPEELAAAVTGLVARRDGTAPCVLVVDDNVKAVERVATTLQAEGYRVLRAYSGDEAIAAARRELPDLLILDLMMPEVSGFEVASALRDSEQTARIPILVLTTRELSAEERARLNSQVSEILAKADFNRSALLAELRRALPGGGKD